MAILRTEKAMGGVKLMEPRNYEFAGFERYFE